MIKFPPVRLTCSSCGGAKYIGEEYYALGDTWVDVTCIKCGHSADIKVNDLHKMLEKIKKVIYGNDN
jgi:hypothetical protein